MACQCRDENGDLRGICLGSCTNSYNSSEVQDFLKFRNELSQISSMLIEMRNEIKDSVNESYRKGFQDGLELAKEMFNE